MADNTSDNTNNGLVDNSGKRGNYHSNFPVSSLVDSNGNMSQEWQMFLLRMYNRTGSQKGIDGSYLARQGNDSTTNIEFLQSEIEDLQNDLGMAYTLITSLIASSANILNSVNNNAIVNILSKNPVNSNAFSVVNIMGM